MAKSNRVGGGSSSRVVREVGVRNGNRASVVNPRAVSQIGESLGNKSATGSDKKVNPVENMYQGRKPQGGPGGVPLGNEIATKGLGVGGGRNLWGQSGSQKQWGPSAPGAGRRNWRRSRERVRRKRLEAKRGESRCLTLKR
jgi:hypothetical protein